MDAEALASTVQEVEQSVQKHFIISLDFHLRPANWRTKTMRSKNLIIACVWTFVTVIVLGYLVAGILWIDYKMMVNVFNVGLLLFFIALTFTGAIVYLMPGNMNPETVLIDELQDIRSRLDELASKVEEAK